MRQLLAAGLVALAATGCSLMLGLTGDEKRPCDQGKCLEGYQCVDDVCVSMGAGTGATCTKATECLSRICTSGACRLPPCEDGEKGGSETDIDTEYLGDRLHVPGLRWFRARLA